LRQLRHEVGATGFDDFLQLVGGDETGASQWTGIRIPAAPGFRYRCLLSVVDLNPGDAVIGIGQYLELLAPHNDSESTPPFYPFVKSVATAAWRFIDGATTWTLTSENGNGPRHNYDPNEMESFAHRDAQTPALVFETAHFPAVPSEPGYLGLDGYTPPKMLGRAEWSIRDLRFPWGSNGGIDLRLEASANTRIRLYCDVLQTNPATRYNPSLSGLNPAWLCPEDQFVLGNFPTTARYGRVAGRILFSRKDQ